MHQLIASSSQVRPKSLRTALAAGLLAIVAACGGSASSGTGSSSANAATTPSGAPAAVGDTNLFGKTVTVTRADGFKFELSASAAHSAPTVHVGGYTENAPPGQTFIAIDVRVRNPLTDRQEPMELVGGNWWGVNTAFALAVPTADVSRFELTKSHYPDGTSANFACMQNAAPATSCLFAGTLGLPDDMSFAPTQIGAAGYIYLQIVYGFVVPESVPFSDVTLFVSNGQAEVQVPPAK